MTGKIASGLLALAVATIVSCTTRVETYPSYATPLPRIQDKDYSMGVTSPFCGYIGNTLVVAGGANYPDRSLAQGGRRHAYKNIWALEGEEWKCLGFLEDSTAWGATFPVKDGLILAGGRNHRITLDKVRKITLDGDGVTSTVLPPIPRAVEQSAYTYYGDDLYILGGYDEDRPLRNVFHFNGEWERLPLLPDYIAQGIALATKDRLYIWGGYNPLQLKTAEGGFRLDLTAENPQWEKIAGIPSGGTLTGSSSLTLPDGRLLVVGGVDKDVFNRTFRYSPEEMKKYLSMAREDYNYRGEVLLFDPETEKWSTILEDEVFALTGAGLCLSPSGEITLVGGEVSPGTPTPRILSFTLKQ